MKTRLLIGGLLAAAALSGFQAAPQRAATQRTTAQSASTVVKQYCVGCHNDKTKVANFSLETMKLATAADHPDVWERVIRKLRAGMMPPPGMPRPPLAQYEGLRDWLETEIDRKAATRPDPGSVVLHRLNRTEYKNAVRDLLDLEIDVASLLPPDDSARGFDNIAGSLTISPTLLEAYTSAASRISRMAVGFWKSPTEAAYISPGDTSQTERIEGLPFGTRGGMAVKHVFPSNGEYKFSIANFGLGKFIPNEKLAFFIDNELVETRDYRGVGLSAANSSDNDGTIDVTIPVKAGSHLVGVTFLAENYRPSLDLIRQYDRKSLEDNPIPQLQYHPAIGTMRIRGPFTATRPDDSRSLRKVYICQPTAAEQEDPCANSILTTLMKRAYRRPVTPQDMEWVQGFYQEGRREGTFQDGIELALRRILTSPQFLVRAEREPANTKVGQSYRITDLELASRLSFLLWSSIPDDALIDIAAKDQLHLPAVLDREVKRMLADPKAEALVSNFTGQWLSVRSLAASEPVVNMFPDFDDNLRAAFKKEVELFFGSIVHEDRSIMDLLTGDYTYVNERLAKHYGIPNIYGPHFRRVQLPAALDARRGLLGKGALLTATSSAARTSPVARGKWYLQTFLGVSPPDPPPDVPAIKEPVADTTGNSRIPTMRETMALHTTNPTCATCHKIFEPMGLALENFDAVGAWRTMDGAAAIDPNGVMVDGTKLEGVHSLRGVLVDRFDTFARVVAEKMLIYALGRGVEYQDMPQVRTIVRDAAANKYKFSSLVMSIVKSDAFRMNMKAPAAPQQRAAR